jgi:hypothetical protein
MKSFLTRRRQKPHAIRASTPHASSNDASIVCPEHSDKSEENERERKDSPLDCKQA